MGQERMEYIRWQRTITMARMEQAKLEGWVETIEQECSELAATYRGNQPDNIEKLNEKMCVLLAQLALRLAVKELRAILTDGTTMGG